MAQAARPLSPHLQIYRWYFTMALSIAHRATGIALSVGLLLFAWWLVALGSGPAAYATFEWLLTSWLGRLAMFGLTFVTFYHAANGVRHLVWDLGYGLDIQTAHRSGIVVVAVTAVLTLLAWIAYFIVR